MTDSDENWKEYRRLILNSLERLEKKLGERESEFADFKAEIKVIKEQLDGKVGDTDFQVMKSKLSFWLAIGMIAVTALIQGAIKMLFE